MRPDRIERRTRAGASAQSLGQRACLRDVVACAEGEDDLPLAAGRGSGRRVPLVKRGNVSAVLRGC